MMEPKSLDPEDALLGVQINRGIHPTQTIRQRMGPALLLALLGAVIGLMLYLDNDAQNKRNNAISSYFTQPTDEGGVVIGIKGAVERPGVYRLEAAPKSPEAESGEHPSETRGSLSQLIDLAGLALPEGVNTPRGWGEIRLQSGAQVEILLIDGAPALGYGQLDPETKLLFNIPLDLNTISAEGLALLPGIGPKTAGSIVAKRQAMGGFSALEDILSIKGVGPRTLENLRPYVTLDAPSHP